MPAIAFEGSKGGAGRSTLATNIAAMAQSAGWEPLIVDMDPQASATTWCDIRELNRQPIECQVANSANLGKLIARAGRRLVIIDTPPHNSTISRCALDHADICVVPTDWGAFDLAALTMVAELVRTVRRPAVAVLNRVQPTIPIAADTYALCRELGLPIRAELGLRVAFRYASAAGLGVHELPRSRKQGTASSMSRACDEMAAVYGQAVELLAAAGHAAPSHAAPSREAV